MMMIPVANTGPWALTFYSSPPRQRGRADVAERKVQELHIEANKMVKIIQKNRNEYREDIALQSPHFYF
jgi:hypothetical protein